jgi:hypothetical protein
MSVQTLKQRSELKFALECDYFPYQCTERNISIWEWCTQPLSKHLQDSLKFTSLGSKKVTASFAKIFTSADKQPFRPAVKRSEPNFELQPLRHHCYNHHLKKSSVNNNKTQVIQNSQLLTGLDGLLLYEYYFPLEDFITCDYNAIVFARKNRKLTGGRCRCPENPT